jgi:hypothetical protein
MSYYSITLDGQICSQNLGFFTTINVYSKNTDNAINKAIHKIRKNMFNNYNFYTDDFIIIDVQKINYNNNKLNYNFYNL